MTAVQISLHFRRVSSTKKAQTEVPSISPTIFVYRLNQFSGFQRLSKAVSSLACNRMHKDS